MNAPIRIELSIADINFDKLTSAIAEKLAILKGDKLPAGVHRIPGTDLLYTTSGDETFTHEGSGKWVKKLKGISGYTAWDLAEKSEAAPLIDDTRFNPAVNAELHPGIGPYLYWLKRVDAQSPSGLAWYAGFDVGVINRGNRSGRGRALAVCRPVSPSQ